MSSGFALDSTWGPSTDGRRMMALDHYKCRFGPNGNIQNFHIRAEKKINHIFCNSELIPKSKIHSRVAFCIRLVHDLIHRTVCLSGLPWGSSSVIWLAALSGSRLGYDLAIQSLGYDLATWWARSWGHAMVTAKEMALGLLWGHTCGLGHCSLFRDNHRCCFPLRNGSMCSNWTKNSAQRHFSTHHSGYKTPPYG